MKSKHKELLSLFRNLSAAQQASALDFMRYLQSTGHSDPALPREPVQIPRPKQEAVVAAIKRLTATYPMLDTARLFDAVSGLMSQHLLSGREAEDVIDELELKFEQEYRAFSDSVSDA